MSALFNGPVSSYLVNFAPTVLGYPFTVGMIFSLTNVGTVQRALWSLSDTATSTNYFEIRMNASEALFQVTASSAVAEEVTGLGFTLIPNQWTFVVARWISATNRRISILHQNGRADVGSGTTSLNPTGIDLMMIGAVSTSQGRDAVSSTAWDGRIAEFWMTNSDAYPNSEENVNRSFMVALRNRGPFAFPHIANNIVEYRSFRKHPTHENDNPDEVYYISSQAIRWTNVNNVRVAPHPPLVPQYQDGFTPMQWRAIKQGWMVSSAAPTTEQMFTRFPARMDGIGYGGIFPGGRLMDKA